VTKQQQTSAGEDVTYWWSDHVVCKISMLVVWSLSICHWHFMWNASSLLLSAVRRVQVSALYRRTDITKAWYKCSFVLRQRYVARVVLGNSAAAVAVDVYWWHLFMALAVLWQTPWNWIVNVKRYSYRQTCIAIYLRYRLRKLQFHTSRPYSPRTSSVFWDKRQYLSIVGNAGQMCRPECLTTELTRCEYTIQSRQSGLGLQDIMRNLTILSHN